MHHDGAILVPSMYALFPFYRRTVPMENSRWYLPQSSFTLVEGQDMKTMTLLFEELAELSSEC
jgi:hypothetical protein